MTDRELLNVDMGEVDDIMDNYQWDWVDMGDNRVCDDCARLSGLPAATYSEWENERTVPGKGDTVCGDNCRCILVPGDLIQVAPDLRAEGKLVIPDEGTLIVDPKTPYAEFKVLDDLIGEYKAVTGGRKLPPQYFEIESVSGRIEYLNDWLRQNG